MAMILLVLLFCSYYGADATLSGAVLLFGDNSLPLVFLGDALLLSYLTGAFVITGGVVVFAAVVHGGGFCAFYPGVVA